MEFLLSDKDLSILKSSSCRRGGRGKSNELFEKRQKEMLILRFEKKWPLRKIGKRYGISRERVRQIIGNSGRHEGGFNYSCTLPLQEIDWKTDYLDKTDEELAAIHNVSLGTMHELRRGIRRQVNEDSNLGIAHNWEEWSSEKLWDNNIPNELMPFGHPFDILALDNIRVDVKVAITPWDAPSLVSADGSQRWRFAVRSGKKRSDADFYLLIIADFEMAFIIPAGEIPRSSYYIVFTWPAKWNRSKYLKYRNRWDLITEFYNAHSIA